MLSGWFGSRVLGGDLRSIFFDNIGTFLYFNELLEAKTSSTTRLQSRTVLSMAAIAIAQYRLRQRVVCLDIVSVADGPCAAKYLVDH